MTADGAARRRGALLLAAPAVTGVVLALVASRRGIYVSHDGLAYLGLARSLAAGDGFVPPPGSAPLGNFPPLYPASLAVAALAGPDPLTVARWLNPLLLGVTTGAVTVALQRATGSRAAALGGGLVVAASADALASHTSALSEPLFLALATGFVLALAAHQRTGSWRLLALAAGLAAGATLVRYLGVALVAGGAVALATGPGPRRRLLPRAASLAAGGLLPLVAWLAWVAARTGSGSNRPVALHGIDGGYLARGVANVAEWIVAVRLPTALATAVVATAVVAAAVVLTARARAPGRPARSAGAGAGAGAGAPSTAAGAPAGAGWSLRLLGWCAAAYVAVLAVYRLLLDVTGRLDDRFLLPLHVAAVAAVATVLGRRRLPRAAAVVALALVAVQVVDGLAWTARATTDPAHRPGGFLGPPYDRSAVLGGLVALPAGALVASNAPDLVDAATGRPAVLLPESRELLSGRANPDLEADLARLRARLAATGGAVAYLTAPPARRAGMLDPQALATALDLAVVTRDASGVLYRALPGPLP